MKLPEPVAWQYANPAPQGGYVIFQQYPQALADLGRPFESLFTESQVKALLTQADDDFSAGMTVVHLQVADQMRRKYEPVLREVLDLLGPEAPECCGCRAEWEMAIAAIKKVLG